MACVVAMAAASGLQGCAPIEAPAQDEEAEGPLAESGDIIVSNTGSDVVLVLNPDGTYKNVIYDVDNTSETVFGLAWDADTEEVLVAVDGADRVVAVSVADGAVRNLVTNANLSGNLRGIAKLLSGDLLVVETSNIERFTSAGTRITAGGWPKALQTTATGISATASGGFVHCSTGTDVVRVYDSSGAQQNTVSSGIGGTTDAAACKVLSDGSVAAAWSGTADTVRIYSADLSTVAASYSDISILSTPQDLAQRANGNIIVLDSAFHHIVEITSSGEFVAVIGGTVLNTPMYVLVVP